MQKTLLMVIVLVVQQPSLFAQRIGLLNKLYEAHLETQMASELQLEPEQIAKLAEHNDGFRREHRGLIRELAAMTPRSSPTGEVPWAHLWPRVKTLNSEIVNNTKASLADPATYRRYCELLTQKYLREGRFEEAAALHGYEIAPELRRRMHERRMELRAKQSERIAQESWDVLTEVLTVFLDRDRLASLSGRIGPQLRLPKPQKRDIFGLYDGLPLRLVMTPAVQVELGLTPEQLQRVRALQTATREEGQLDQMLATFQGALRQEDLAVVDAAEKKLAEGIQQLNERIAAGVQQVLKPSQHGRFEQLLFQQYVRQQELSRALELAGIPADRFDRLKHPNDPLRQAFNRKWDEAKLQLRYVRQLDQLNSGAKVFELVAGEGGTQPLMGDISLAPEDPFLQDEALRKRLTQAFRARSSRHAVDSSPHPRRRHREKVNP